MAENKRYTVDYVITTGNYDIHDKKKEMSRKCDCGYDFQLINKFGRFEVYKCLKCEQLCIYRG